MRNLVKFSLMIIDLGIFALVPYLALFIRFEGQVSKQYLDSVSPSVVTIVGKKHSVQEIIIAMPSISGSIIREFVKRSSRTKGSLKVLPGCSNIKKLSYQCANMTSLA